MSVYLKEILVLPIMFTILVKIILGSHDPMTQLYCLFQGLHGLPGLPGPKGDKVSVKLNLIKFILV